MPCRWRWAAPYRYKVVTRPDGNGEIYDLTVDPREKVNQYANPQFQTVRNRLSAALEEWKKGCPA